MRRRALRTKSKNPRPIFVFVLDEGGSDLWFPLSHPASRIAHRASRIANALEKVSRAWSATSASWNLPNSPGGWALGN